MLEPVLRSRKFTPPMDLQPILITVITSGISAWVGSQLGRASSISQKRWDQKAKAYSDLIGALHNLRRYYDVKGGASLASRMNPDPAMLERQRLESWLEVEKAMDIGSWHMAKEVGMQLMMLESRFSGKENETEDPGGVAMIIWEVLTKIVGIAKRDLGT